MRYDRPPRIERLLEKIKKSIEKEDYKFSYHAIKRGEERFISYQDALYVLINGYHEKMKTSFDVIRRTWKYAIRGKTVDGNEIRVIVAFEQEMIIITVISLSQKKPRRKS